MQMGSQVKQNWLLDNIEECGWDHISAFFAMIATMTTFISSLRYIQDKYQTLLVGKVRKWEFWLPPELYRAMGMLQNQATLATLTS